MLSIVSLRSFWLSTPSISIDLRILTYLNPLLDFSTYFESVRYCAVFLCLDLTMIFIPKNSAIWSLWYAQFLLEGIFTFSGMLASALLWGYLSDTLGRKQIMVWGFLASSLVEMISAMTQNFPMLLTTRFISGFLWVFVLLLTLTFAFSSTI